MRPTTRTTLLALALTGTALAGPAAADPATVSRQVTGLVADGTLVTFDSGDVGTILSSVTVTGLGAGETLVAIDYRPNGGVLYGVTDAADGQRLYTIDAAGTASQVGTGTFANVPGDISIDFNPAVDRVRVVSSEGANLRVHPVTGARVDAPNDGSLKYGTAAATGIAGAAYIDNRVGATGLTTRLFDLDATLDQLAVQDPPNSGALTARGPVEQDLGLATGFDINTTPSKVDEAFASLSKNGKSRLFVIDLTSGFAKPAGKIGADVVDIALPIGQGAPAT